MAKGRAYKASLLIDVTLAAAKSGRVYQGSLLMPNEAPPLRSRLYQAALTLPAAGGGLKGRLYMAGMTTPVPAEQTPPSGIWAAVNGNVRPCGLRAAVNGAL